MRGKVFNSLIGSRLVRFGLSLLILVLSYYSQSVRVMRLVNLRSALSAEMSESKTLLLLVKKQLLLQVKFEDFEVSQIS
jgi:hypothetical protein